MVRKDQFFALLIALSCFFQTPQFSMAQTGTWAVSAGSSGREYIADVLVDAAGNAYVAGYFTDSTIFEGTKLIGQGGNDAFLAKYDATGQIAWVKHYGWSANEFTRALAFDWDGDVLLMGDYQDSTIIGSDTLYSLDTLWYGPPALTYDVFLLKVDPASGNVKSIYADGWFSSERVYDMEVDGSARRIFGVTWHSFSWWQYGMWGRGFHDAMIVALDSSANLYTTNNNLRFTMRNHAWGANFDEAREVEVIGDSLYVLGGTFQDTCYFRDSTVYGVTDFEDDIYITTHDDTAGFAWAITGGSAVKDRMTGMVHDPAGNLYATGTFQGTFLMGGQSTIGAGNLDGFIAKVDKDGNALWTVALGGTGFDAIEAITYRASGDLIVTGYFQGEISLGGQVLTSSDSLDQDMFVASVDPNSGAVNWAWSGGGPGLDGGYAVESDAAGNIYVLGTFNGTATFGQAVLVSKGSDDLVLLRMDQNGSVSVPGGTVLASKLDLYPNPADEALTIAFELQRGAAVDISVVDLSGKVVYANPRGKLAPGRHLVDLSTAGFAPGMYFVRVAGSDFAATKKLVISH